MRSCCKYFVVRRSLLIIAIFVCMILPDHGCDGLSSNINSNINSNAAPPADRIITQRATAVFALMESIKKKNVFAIRVLEQDPAYLKLEQRDRAFARLLLSTAERRSGQIEKVIKSFEKEKKKKNSKVRVCVEWIDDGWYCEIIMLFWLSFIYLFICASILTYTNVASSFFTLPCRNKLSCEMNK